MIGSILTSKVIRRLIAIAPRGRSRVARMISRRYPRDQEFQLVGALSGARMRLSTADPFQAEMAFGAYQPDFMDRLRHLVRPGDVVLTAGAHLGYIPLALAKAVGPKGKVIAFEADPRIVKQCQSNLELNNAQSIVKLFPFGLGASNGELEMALSATAAQSSFAIAHNYARTASVMVRKGDEILAELGVTKIDGLVLDVEGWEMKVLEGLLMTISNELPRWAIIECWDVALKNAGSSAEDLSKKLRALGWAIKNIEGGSASDGSDILCMRPWDN